MAGKKSETVKATGNAGEKQTFYYVVQQGRIYSVVPGTETPDLATEEGQRTKKLHGQHDTMEDAQRHAERLAEHYQGEVQKA